MYLTQAKISESQSMKSRVAQAAAQQAAPGDPDTWTFATRRYWAAAPGWDAAWESALVAHPEDDYDPGADESVITDGMILSQVQSMLSPQEG